MSEIRHGIFWGLDFGSGFFFFFGGGGGGGGGVGLLEVQGILGGLKMNFSPI